MTVAFFSFKPSLSVSPPSALDDARAGRIRRPMSERSATPTPKIWRNRLSTFEQRLDGKQGFSIVKTTSK